MYNSICISLDLLLSPADDPYTEYNLTEIGYSDFVRYTRFVLVPVNIDLVDDDGNILLRFDNKSTVGIYGTLAPKVPSPGQWKSPAEAGETGAYLTYYTQSPSKNSAFEGAGWHVNRPDRNMSSLEPSVYKRTGTIIPTPGCRGRIRVTVGHGLLCYGLKTDSVEIMPDSVYSSIKWCLYKDIRVELLNEYFATAKLDDAKEIQDINDENNEVYSETLQFGTPLRYTPGLKSIYFFPSSDPSGAEMYAYPSIVHSEMNQGSLQSLKRARLRQNYFVPRLVLNGIVRESLDELFASTPYMRIYNDGKSPDHYFVIGSQAFYPRSARSEIKAKEVIIDS